MPVKILVKSADSLIRRQRSATAQRVLDYFGSNVPASRLLCFLDAQDPPSLRDERGPDNRGLYGPIYDNTPLPQWPEYVIDHVYEDDDMSAFCRRAIDDLIYLYGSTCSDEVGLTMTLAHELQHAITKKNLKMSLQERRNTSNTPAST
jgi:hypothetical protein